MYAIRSYYGTLAGAAMVVSSGLYLIYRERMHHRLAGPQRPVITSYSIHYTKLYDLTSRSAEKVDPFDS